MTPIRMDAFFPADDPVAQWVFSLSLVANDLMVLEGPMKKSAEDDDIRAMIAVYRQMVIRLYEARRLILAIDKFQEIADFLGLEKQPKLLMRLRDVYTPKPGEARSQIELLYGELRHKSVHYPWVGKDEIRDVLR